MNEVKVAAISTHNWIGDPRKSLLNISGWIERAKQSSVNLILFPELCLSGYVLHDVVNTIAETIPGASTDAVIGLARQYDIMISVGLLELDDGKIYNTQVIVDSNGIIGKQRKTHLPEPEQLYWNSGDYLDVFDTQYGRIGIAICYDALFPEVVKTLYLKGAEIILMPFLDVTCGPRSKFPEEDITGICYRATCYLNGCYGILANSAGDREPSEFEPNGCSFPGWAGIFGPDGQVVSFIREPGNGEAMAIATLNPMKLNESRKDIFFIPNNLRPQIYEK